MLELWILLFQKSDGSETSTMIQSDFMPCCLQLLSFTFGDTLQIFIILFRVSAELWPYFNLYAELSTQYFSVWQ